MNDLFAILGAFCAGWVVGTLIPRKSKDLIKHIVSLQTDKNSLQDEVESLAIYRRLWEAAAIELRAANAKIAKLEKVPKKVKK